MAGAPSDLSRKLGVKSGAQPSDLIWNDELLIEAGSWEDVGLAAINVRQKAIRHLVQYRAIPVALGLRYWQLLPESGAIRGIGLWWVQTGPSRVYHLGMRALYNEDSITTKILAKHEWKWPRLKRLDFGALWQARSLSKLAHAGRGWLLWHWRQALSVVYAPVIAESNAHCELLKAQRVDAASKLGKLLTESWKGSSVDERVANTVGLLGGCILEQISQPPSTPKEALEILQKVLEQLSHDKANAKVDIPSMATRWWPALVLGGVAAYYIAGSWQDLVYWLTHSVADTLRSFWVNWVYEPVRQVILTIRHDPHAEITLMAKESLDSDVASLERMVADFVSSNGSIDTSSLQVVRENTRNGDLTPVLEAYERQITTPISSLLSGKLLRTLLIQVQKGKVDVEVALSGIDRLLQSQQLVFGITAALPALFVVIWAGRALLGRITGYSSRKRTSRSSEVREEFLERLGTINELATDTKSSTLTHETVGLVFIETELAKRAFAGLKGPGMTRKRQVAAMLDRLSATQNRAELLAELDRVLLNCSFI